MKRCRHDRTLVEERSDHFVCSEIQDGKTEFSFESGPHPTSTGFVSCRDCGVKYRYGIGERVRARLPRWAIGAVEVAEG